MKSIITHFYHTSSLPAMSESNSASRAFLTRRMQAPACQANFICVLPPGQETIGLRRHLIRGSIFRNVQSRYSPHARES